MIGGERGELERNGRRVGVAVLRTVGVVVVLAGAVAGCAVAIVRWLR